MSFKSWQFIIFKILNKAAHLIFWILFLSESKNVFLLVYPVQFREAQICWAECNHCKVMFWDTSTTKFKLCLRVHLSKIKNTHSKCTCRCVIKDTLQTKHYIAPALLVKQLHISEDNYLSWSTWLCNIHLSRKEKQVHEYQASQTISFSFWKFITCSSNIEFIPWCGDLGLTGCCDTWLASVTRAGRWSNEGPCEEGIAPSWVIGDTGWGRWLIDWGWLGDKQCSA